MNSAQWWPENDLFNQGALVDVLTYGDETSIVKKYDGTVLEVPTRELERRG